MRIVCDANILVRAALHPQGPARAILTLGTRIPHALITSEPILAEVRRVLAYDRIQRRYGIGDGEIEEFIARLSSVSDLVALPADIPLLSIDRDDDAIIATAILGGADALCTLDRHLRDPFVLAYCATFSVRVVTDTELLSALRQSAA